MKLVLIVMLLVTSVMLPHNVQHVHQPEVLMVLLIMVMVLVMIVQLNVKYVLLPMSVLPVLMNSISTNLMHVLLVKIIVNFVLLPLLPLYSPLPVKHVMILMS